MYPAQRARRRYAVSSSTVKDIRFQEWRLVPTGTPNDWYDDHGKLRDVGSPTELKKFWNNTGRMQRSRGVTTDDLGHFVLPLPRQQWESGILAFDASRQRGGIATLYGENEKSELVIQLQPLVHLHGKLRMAETGSIPPWSVMCVYVPADERKPLASSRVAACGSWDGNVSLTLPPGEYDLTANTDEASEILNPSTLKIKLTDTELDYDLGTLRLYPHLSLDSKIKDAKQRREWGDYTTSIGKVPPPWHAVVARGISAGTKPTDLKGKWTLLYFFTFNCGHCLAAGLPEAAKFYELNRDKRTKFEIIGFCVDHSGELSSLEKLERKLQPIVKSVWKGKDLPFPLLLDNTFTTQKTYGITFSPTEVLIDPEGKVVKGGLKELAKKNRSIHALTLNLAMADGVAAGWPR